jgi:class 3 adenylate cyclase
VEAVETQPTGTERKLVTVLFADLEGSTGLGERLDPERLGELLERYFAAMREQIEAEGGTVEKFIGDAVVAAFGVPTAHEDDPSRALRAALRMRRRLAELNPELERAYGAALRVRTGVNTGEVLATVGPHPGEPMVTGDTVNTAARLEQLAEPGEIVVAERTARAARAFPFRPLGALQLRGRAAGVAAVVLEGDEPSRPDRGVPGLRAPMIGRDRELAVLRSVYERAVEESRPALVTVYGDPGVGKSRLTREFAEWAEGVEGGASVLRGRCLPHGEGATYWPLAEILKSLAGIRDSDAPGITLDRLRAFGADRLTREVATDPTKATAALAYTVGVEDPEHPFSHVEPREMRSKIHAAWRSLFSALARDRPVIAVVEDIHWADSALLDLLEELADRVVGPVVFVCPARPELTESRPAWGGGRRNRSSIALEPLAQHDAARLIGFLLAVDDLPERVRSRVLERAEGNPFFLEEIVRHLIDNGRIVHADGRWRATSDVDDVEIPDTIQGVLAARIDLLDANAKRTLQRAAVVGRVFWPGPVGRLGDGDGDALREMLHQLEERELVLSRLGSAIAGQPEYIFRHVLTREVAYESLPRRERGSAHAEVARWLEDTAGGRAREFVDLLAYHWEEAYRSELESPSAGGRPLDELRDKAFEALRNASEVARRRFAVRHATSLSDRALAIAADGEQRAVALEQAGFVALSDYRGDRAWDSFGEAIELRLRATPDDGVAIAAACARAVEAPTRWPGSMRTMVEEEEVRRLIDVGFAHVPEGDSEERVRLLIARAFQPFAVGMRRVFDDPSLREAEEAGLVASDMAVRLGRPDLASAALDAAASVPGNRGDYGRMLEINARRLPLIHKLDDPLEIGDIYSMNSWCNAYVGNLREAREYAAEGARSAGDAPTLVGCLSWLAFAEFSLGNWDAVVTEIQPTIEQHLGDRADAPPYFTIPAFGSTAFILAARSAPAAARYIDMLRGAAGVTQGYSSGMVEAWIAWIAAIGGKPTEGRATFDTISEGARLGTIRPFADVVEATLLAEERRWDVAPAFVETTRRYAFAARLVALPPHLDRLEALATLAEADGAGLEGLANAADALERIGARWDRAVVDLDLARSLTDHGRRDEALQLLTRAAETFEELRAVRDVERARALRAVMDG